jgi:hypothetical protein
VRFVLLPGLKEDGSKRWSPPLDLEKRDVRARRTTKAFVDGGYTVTETFVIHNCPEREAAQARALLVSQNREIRARHTEEAWVEALKRPCPKCEAETGARCSNLTDVRLGRPVQITRWPHVERLPPGWSRNDV